MIKKYNEFINEGIFDLLSGYSMVEVKEKLNRLTPLDRYVQLKKLKLKYEDVYTQEEMDNFTNLDKIYASNKYDWIDDLYENRIRVLLNDKIGFIDINGNEIIPIKYDWVSSFYKNRARVKLNNKWGMIDENGNEITPIKYKWLGDIDNNGLSTFNLDNNIGYIDINGNETRV